MIITTDYMPFRIAGICLWKNLIIVRKDAPDSIIAHEQVHSNEWSPLWLVKYLLSPVFRMKAELRAYTVQAEIEGVPITHYYETIRDIYWLNGKAKKMLYSIMYEDMI